MAISSRPDKTAISHREPPKKQKLGEILIRRGCLTHRQLNNALRLKRIEKARLGEILTARGYIKPDQLLAALSEQSEIPVIDLSQTAIAQHLLRSFDISFCLKHSYIPIDVSGPNLRIAISDPHKAGFIIRHLRALGFQAQVFLCLREDIRNQLNLFAGYGFSHSANLRCAAKYSCRSWNRSRTRLAAAFVIFIVAFLALTFPLYFVNMLMFWILLNLIASTALRVICLNMRNRCSENINPRIELPAGGRLPKVSILIPLLNEADILPRLIDRMQMLNYPRELLDICLIYECGDRETRDHLLSSELPNWMRYIEVPASSIQTKPRAMNYALNFDMGDIIGVYDAEDAPEPDQIMKVVTHLQTAPKDVACVQGTLDYYNSETNWISRCFTIEYAVLFRIVLKGLDHLRLPLPLGGTTVFFRRSILERLGCWDAYNVTEDADLGMRLARFGYRCERIETTTYEEANYRLFPWVKQRSRWLKGFLLTWMTHMRNPGQLYSDLGAKGFLVFNVLFLSSFTSFLTAPLVWPFWLMTFGYSPYIATFIDHNLLISLLVCFVLSEISAQILYFKATSAPALRHLRPRQFFMIFYWPLGSAAAYKALIELFIWPNFWDKTQHGLNDADYHVAIDRLTGWQKNTLRKRIS